MGWWHRDGSALVTSSEVPGRGVKKTQENKESRTMAASSYLS